MSIYNFFNRSFTDSVLGDIEPKKDGVIPASEYPLCPDCQSPSGLSTSPGRQQAYICKNNDCKRFFSESTKNQPRKQLNNPPCPDCGSLQVHKRGICKKTGKVKYTCYDCLRNFRESNSNVKSNLLIYKDKNISFEIPCCPDCGEQNINTRGFEVSKDGSRKQKYSCKNCKKTFCESSSNRPKCPECQESNWVIKRGLSTKNERQKFFCQKCSKTFTPNSRPPCPDCGSFWIRKKGIDKRTKEQKYFCNDCERIFTEATKNQPRKQLNNPPCPECNSKEVVRHTTNKKGSQRYRCKSCREFFFEYRDNPPCPDCKSVKVKKAGVRRNQYQYQCKNCHRHFSESTKNCPKNSPKIFDINSDYWDLREMGASFPPSASWFSANFERIKFEWLKTASKNYVKHLVISKVGATCLGKLEAIVKFSRFLSINYPELNYWYVDRNIIVDFIGYLKNEFPKPKSSDIIRHTITTLDEFIKLSHRFQWLEIPNPNLIFPEDLPRLSKSGKTFDQIVPDEVLEQFVENLDGLPIVFARMAFLMLSAPIRISEVCGMRFDCIKKDKGDDWWLHFWDYKLNKEHNPIPIRKEVAEVIKLQQTFTREKLGQDYKYLFCSRKNSARKDGTYSYIDRPPSASNFRVALKKLAQERNITYEGEIYSDLSKTHYFRHTGASDLINKGMPLVMVQEILGHETPEMTLVYAKLYDDTLKETWKEVAPKIVDITGKVTKVERSKLNSPKYQKMKRIVLEQQVNNGICGLSVHQKCPKFHACYTCSKFQATEDNLPGLKADREQLKAEIKQLEGQSEIYKQENKLRLAEGCRDRMKQSREIVQNLNKIISGLESHEAS